MRAWEAYRLEKEAHQRTCEELQMFKVQVAKLQRRLSGSGIYEDRDGQGSGSECTVNVKGKYMGGAMK